MKKVEMHCHILPGIDDGAEDMKQSLQMLHIAMEHRDQSTSRRNNGYNGNSMY